MSIFLSKNINRQALCLGGHAKVQVPGAPSHVNIPAAIMLFKERCGLLLQIQILIVNTATGTLNPNVKIQIYTRTDTPQF